jgi:hypothetical protein
MLTGSSPAAMASPGTELNSGMLARHGDVEAPEGKKS